MNRSRRDWATAGVAATSSQIAAIVERMGMVLWAGGTIPEEDSQGGADRGPVEPPHKIAGLPL